MSALNVFHEVVKRALQKDGWQITHDQFSISVSGVNISIDLAAQRLLAAERGEEKRQFTEYARLLEYLPKKIAHSLSTVSFAMSFRL